MMVSLRLLNSDCSVPSEPGKPSLAGLAASSHSVHMAVGRRRDAHGSPSPRWKISLLARRGVAIVGSPGSITLASSATNDAVAGFSCRFPASSSCPVTFAR